MISTMKLRDLRNQAAEMDGQQVTIAGWVRTIRESRNFAFMELSDGSCFGTVQVVLERESLPQYDLLCAQNVGASVIITGNVVVTPQAKQPFEIKATQGEVEGESTPTFPMQKKRHTMEYLRTQAHLRPRTNTFQAVLRVRSLTAYAIHRFFQERNFVYVHTPIITTRDC